MVTQGISRMRLEEVEAKLQELGWQADAGVKLTLLEKKSVLRELIEKRHEPSHQPNDYRNLSKKTKEELRHICVELQIQTTGNETKPQLTRKIKEWQTPPEVTAEDTRADFGKYRGQTYEWIWSHDLSYCLWVTDTVVEEGDKCSSSLKRLAEYIENRRQTQSRAAPGKGGASTSAAPASPDPSPDTLDLRKRKEDLEEEIERLQRQMDEMKSQLSTRRRKTFARDADMKDADS